jgi:hypothetical protein
LQGCTFHKQRQPILHVHFCICTPASSKWPPSSHQTQHLKCHCPVLDQPKSRSRAEHQYSFVRGSVRTTRVKTGSLQGEVAGRGYEHEHERRRSFTYHRASAETCPSQTHFAAYILPLDDYTGLQLSRWLCLMPQVPGFDNATPILRSFPLANDAAFAEVESGFLLRPSMQTQYHTSTELWASQSLTLVVDAYRILRCGYASCQLTCCRPCSKLHLPAIN